MKKILTFTIFFSIAVINNSYSREVKSVNWSHKGNTAYNSCMIILTFICSLEQNVTSDVSSATINQFIVVYNKKNELIKKFKVKKIEYKNGRCWLTPQPIRRYTTYFTTDNCKVIRE